MRKAVKQKYYRDFLRKKEKNIGLSFFLTKNIWAMTTRIGFSLSKNKEAA